MHWVDYPIRLNLLEYLIKHVMFTCLPYNLNGYKMCMSRYYKEWWHKGSQHPKENIYPKELNHLCFKREHCINLDKITGFVKFCNQNRCPKFCNNYVEALQDDISFLISLCKRSRMLIIGGWRWIKMFMNIVEPMTNVK